MRCARAVSFEGGSVPHDESLFGVSSDFARIHLQVFVRKRPGVDEFLKRVARQYEVIVFTASLPTYANPLLDLVRSALRIGYM